MQRWVVPSGWSRWHGVSEQGGTPEPAEHSNAYARVRQGRRVSTGRGGRAAEPGEEDCGWLLGHCDARGTQAAFTLSQSVALLDACTVLGHFERDTYLPLLASVTRLVEDDLGDGVVNQLNRIMYCIRTEVEITLTRKYDIAQFPELINDAPPPTQTLIGLYQGHFLEATPFGPRSTLYDCLEEVGIPYERSATVGPYRVDALVNGHVALDLLAEASLCPVTREPLGSVRLKNRHLEAMGYRPAQLAVRDWLRRESKERMACLEEALAL
ncbi:RAP domain protein [Babesia caballi]|uniref:RAP domain protein n=1 Tax=Babesia caballi TaxID=5871 RepID=A0AAV4LMA4_BABCB|nr:RAP domain protein [Babesia caballi]